MSPPTATSAASLEHDSHTLYSVIKLVSSSIELEPMLQGVVDLATEATGCHACFIYLLEDDGLTIRAASEVFADAVGRVTLSLDEGLTGWVARHGTPEFIREQAMDDPRMTYVPLLREEHFQSMVAVPILARSAATLGVVVLHTQAPHEFTEETVELLVHIASLVSGAIENAQIYGRELKRVNGLTRLAALGGEVASVTDADELGRVVANGVRGLLDAEFCQIYRLDAQLGELEMLVSDPSVAPAPPALSTAGLLIDALNGNGGAPAGHSLWPGLQVGDVLVSPLSAGGERLGFLCAGSTAERAFSSEDKDLADAVAHLAAIAMKRAELIRHLTDANIVKDIFEALAAGATAFAVAKAAELGCDLTGDYLILCGEPAGTSQLGSVEWRHAAELACAEIAARHPRAAIEAGPGLFRAAVPLQGGGPRLSNELAKLSRELGEQNRAVIGMSQLYHGASSAARAYSEAIDAGTIGRALLPLGGALSYSQLGAYRYLVHIDVDEAPRDRMSAAVDELIDYDAKRNAALLNTLESYLSERRSVTDTARALFIHPNTLRQRLARIEELTALELDRDDLLSLELAIKVARLHGRPHGSRTGAPQPLLARRSTAG
jgi:GAF domain-containing protein